LAACALGLGAVLLVGINHGGYHEGTWRWATVALVAIAGIQLLLRRRADLGRLEWLALGALGCLAAWMLLSDFWGIAGTEAWREAERCALYVAALAAFVLVIQRGTSKALLVGTLVGIVAIAGYALGERLVDPPALDPYQGALLKGPVGYANALGILAAIGVLLAVGLLRDETGWARRALLCCAAGVCAVALTLTSSRGSWLALVVGLAVLVVAGSPGVRSHRLLAVQVTTFLAAVLVLVMAPRLSFGDRPAYWQVAVESAVENPVAGSGAGSFDDVWLDRLPIPAFVRDAHSLYLETAAELGLVGVALLVCALGAPLIAAARAQDRSVAATAAAAYSAFLVHAGMDWDWEMPVTTLAGLACAAACLVAARVHLSRS
jgi:O-antigen ligase